MFVVTVTMLRCGRCDASRIPHDTAGNGWCTASSVIVCPACASPLAFSATIRSWTARSRGTGSDTSTGRNGSMSEIRLSCTPPSPGARTDTGTSERMACLSGSSPRDSSSSRNAPLAAASTTSLRLTS